MTDSESGSREDVTISLERMMRFCYLAEIQFECAAGGPNALPLHLTGDLHGGASWNRGLPVATEIESAEIPTGVGDWTSPWRSTSLSKMPCASRLYGAVFTETAK
jgi:hypothetical protein